MNDPIAATHTHPTYSTAQSAVAGSIISRPSVPTRGRSLKLRRLEPLPKNERRKKERVSVTMQVRFKHGRKIPDAIGKAIDLSATGMFIQTQRLLRPYSLVAVTMKPLEEEPEICVVCTVVWCGRRRGLTGFGLRMIYAERDEYMRLLALLESASSPQDANPRKVVLVAPC